MAPQPHIDLQFVLVDLNSRSFMEIHLSVPIFTAPPIS
jgi:hypothetical protein